MVSYFKEELHPRAGKGSGRLGGRFTKKGGGGAPGISAASSPTGGWLLDGDDQREIAEFKQVANHQELPDQTAGFDKAQREDLDEYQVSSFAAVNHYLRNEQPQEKPSDQEIVDTLDSMMQDLPENLLVHRYYRQRTGGKLRDMKPGDTLVDKGFMSTTTQEAIAARKVKSTNLSSDTSAGGAQSITILAPMGSKALIIGTEHGHEGEIIFARGSRLEYIGENETGQRFFRLHQEAPPEEPIVSGKSEKTVLPEKVVQAFSALGDEQRGDPEKAMLRIQFANAGFINPIVEHTGDLTHRMTEMAKYGDAGYDAMKEKVPKLLRKLEDRHAVEREIESNFKSNAKYQGVPVEDLKAKVYDLMDKYAEEHAKLPVYNEAQWRARQAAILVGRREYQLAWLHLDKLNEMMPDRATWTEHAFKYELNSSGEPIEWTPDQDSTKKPRGR